MFISNILKYIFVDGLLFSLLEISRKNYSTLSAKQNNVKDCFTKRLKQIVCSL